jgi:transposase-like protein
LLLCPAGRTSLSGGPDFSQTDDGGTIRDSRPNLRRRRAPSTLPKDVALGFQRRERPGRHLFELDDGSNLRVAVKVEGGQVEFSTVEIEASNVTSTLLHVVPVGAMREEVRRQLVGHPALADGWAVLAELRRGSGLDVPEHLARAEKEASAAVERLAAGMGRRRRVDAEFLRDFARRAVAVGGSRRLLADEFYVSKDTVARWVGKAREAGWLAETGQGKTGAAEGPKLIEWLDEHEGEAE